MKKLGCYYDSYKPNKFSRANVNQLGYRGDIISCLPVSIRSHIVSFLPMKEAIRSMILSRRWRNICYSLSNLEFKANEFKNMRDFKNFVNKTLILCSGSDVDSFSLTMEDYDIRISIDHVCAWITFAIQHNVQDLSIDLCYDRRRLELPSCVFSSSTLTRLSLSYCENLKWPKVINFPMLEHLEVEGIIFYDEEVSNTLFSSYACPVLEELVICFCEFERIHTLSISFPSLNCLQLIGQDSLYINVSIPILHEIHYECFLPPKISYETLSSMLHAHFFLSMPDTISEEHAFCNSAKKILTGLCKVHRLSLSSDILEILARDPNLLAYMPPSYSSLKHLHLIIMPSKSHIGVIAWLLSTSPNLQVLDITIEVENSISSDIIHMEGFWQLNKLSICTSLKHLKSVEIKNFVGRENEMEIVRRLLESACILEKMYIFYAVEKSKDAEKRTKINEKLLSFKRVSPYATMLFS